MSPIPDTINLFSKPEQSLKARLEYAILLPVWVVLLLLSLNDDVLTPYSPALSVLLYTVPQQPCCVCCSTVLYTSLYVQYQMCMKFIPKWSNDKSTSIQSQTLVSVTLGYKVKTTAQRRFLGVLCLISWTSNKKLVKIGERSV